MASTKPDGVSWGDYVSTFPHTYPTPADVPGGVPLVPGHTELQKDWVSWGLAWRAHYDTTAPKPQTVDPTGKPSLPLPGATDEEWLAYGLEMTEWSKKQNAAE